MTQRSAMLRNRCTRICLNERVRFDDFPVSDRKTGEIPFSSTLDPPYDPLLIVSRKLRGKLAYKIPSDGMNIYTNRIQVQQDVWIILKTSRGNLPCYETIRLEIRQISASSVRLIGRRTNAGWVIEYSTKSLNIRLFSLRKATPPVLLFRYFQILS